MRTQSRFGSLLQVVMFGAITCGASGCAIPFGPWPTGDSASGGSGGSTTQDGDTGGGSQASSGSVAMATSSTATTGVGGAASSSSSSSATTGVGGGSVTTTTSTTSTAGVGGGNVTTTTSTTGVGGGATTGTGTSSGAGGAIGAGGAPGAGGATGAGGAIGAGGGDNAQTSSSSATGASTSTTSVGSGAAGSTTSATTGSASSSTGGPRDDTCPGQPFSIDVGVTVTLSGTTVGATDNFNPPASSCFGAPDASGPDVVYALTFESAGTLTTKLTSSNGLQGVLYAESSCGDASSLLFCGKADDSGQRADAMAVTSGQTAYFVIDGDAGSAGDFAFEISLNDAACGDGVLNPGEECDDGNLIDGDGCSATCMVEVPVDDSDTCPGDNVSIDMSQTLDIQGVMPAPLGPSTTLNYHDDYTTCDGIVYGSPTGTGPDQNGNDRVFAFVPAADGTLFLQLRNLGDENGGFDGMLSAWANTCSPGPASDAFDWSSGTDPANGDYMGCSDHAYGTDAWDPASPDDPLTQESLTFPVTAGTPYFVVVDGYAGYSTGQFWLHAELTP